MSYPDRHVARRALRHRLEACAWTVLLASSAAVSCAAKLPVGTVDGRAASRYSGSAPALAAVPTAASAEHVVQPGETLWRIATQNGVSVDALALANGIEDPTQLRVGQKLTIPGGASLGQAGSPAPKESGSVALERAKALARGDSKGAPSAPAEKPAEKPPVASKAPPQKPAPKTTAPKVATKPKARKPAARVSVAKYPLRWPVRGKIARAFGRRGKKHHDGIDIIAGTGEPVRAAGSGKVVFADEHGGYGKLVLVRHESGVITVYAHQSELLVKKGQRVKGGQVIAKVGSTGNAERPHLHFEVRKGIESKNPLQFLPP